MKLQYVKGDGTLWSNDSGNIQIRIASLDRGTGSVADLHEQGASIVRACNAHDALVAALASAENWLSEYERQYALDDGQETLLVAMRAALKLARGE